VPPKLDATHRAFLARIVEEGPIPAVHGVVRWRACDLIMRLHEEFEVSVSDDTIYRALKDLGFSHVSARPKAYKQAPEAIDAFKKTSSNAWRKSERARAGHTGRGVVPGRDADRAENQAHLSLARKGSRPRAIYDQRTQSTYLFRRGLPRARSGRRARAAGLQQRSHAAELGVTLPGATLQVACVYGDLTNRRPFTVRVRD
jgi:hypothetical protein